MLFRSHNIDVVVDRVVIRDGVQTRLADSLQTALHLADGLAVAELAGAPSFETPPAAAPQDEAGVTPPAAAPQDEEGEGALSENTPHPEERAGRSPVGVSKGEPRQILFSEKFACPVSGFTIAEIEPRLFSFNNPFGACPACDGLGLRLEFDAALIVPDEEKSLADGAIKPWAWAPRACIARHWRRSVAITAPTCTRPGSRWQRIFGKNCSMAPAPKRCVSSMRKANANTRPKRP